MQERTAAPKLRPAIHGRERVFCCHRSTLSGRFAPNSLEAIRECVDAAAPRIEIDVRFMADDAMLVFHDATLDRETHSRGRVADLSRAGAAGARYRTGERLCVLEAAVEALRGSQTTLQVDLKAMRPLSPVRAQALVSALRPVREQVLVGSQAHWNLRMLAASGLPLALDPTFHLNAIGGDTAEGRTPARVGLAGFWDDAPLAHIPGVEPAFYLRSRIEDMRGLLPAAAEWMVDIKTILRYGECGIALGAELRLAGIELAAWTLREVDARSTPGLLERLFALDVTTVITDRPLAAAACLQ